MLNAKQIVTALVGLMAIAGTSFARDGQEFDAPDQVTVKSLVFAGTGCPAGSVASNVSPDRTAFTLLFDNYIAQVGPGVPFKEKRKNCQLNVQLDFPQGWSFSLVQVDVRGYGSLDPGVTGEQLTSFYFQGDQNTVNLPYDFAGPMDDNYEALTAVPVVQQVWSPCGAVRSLNINTSVKLMGAGNGLLTVDSLDGQVQEIYGIQWRRCQ
jgi:hypothetical protein